MPKPAKTSVHLCDFCESPKPGLECWTAIWSEGRACKSCDHECYRRGWLKWQVDADNHQLVLTTKGGPSRMRA